MRKLLPLLLVFLCFAAQSQPIIPEKGTGSKFFINCANVYFEVDSARGARISSFKLDGNEIMYVDFKKNDMAGSTFWPSPQSVWNWPPPVNLDSKPFKTTIKENKITFRGNIDTKTSLRFYKTVAANSADTSIIIDYCIKNEKNAAPNAAQNWAPWEITRVLNSGLTVFSKGEGKVTGDMASRTKEITGYIWYDQDATLGQSGAKFFCDGKGWLAHVVDGEMLFIKKFEDIPLLKAAPKEAEIEVYTAGDQTYTELENQGVYGSIAAKDSVSWRVKWFARKLPASVEVKVGSTSLTNYIESVLKRETPVTSIASQANNQIKVYPNPATNLLSVELGKNLDKNTMLQIFDIQGRLVLSCTMSQSKNQINVGQIQRGFYIYEVTQGNESLSRGQLLIRD